MQELPQNLRRQTLGSALPEPSRHLCRLFEWPQRSPTFSPPEQSCRGQFRKIAIARETVRKVSQTFGGSQKGGFQKGGFGGCSPGTKTGTRVRSPNHPFTKPPFYLPVTLFGVDKRVVSKRVVSADVPPERKPERGYAKTTLLRNRPFISQ